VTQPAVEIVEADLRRPEHQRDVVALTDAYARDPMGNDGPLPPEVLARLPTALRDHPTTLILLAYTDQQAVGIATCFLGFSTFAARPLTNVHDLAVLPAHRGRGIARLLLAAVEDRARQLGCCKITLEVQENNQRAQRLYASAGFAHALAATAGGGALFYAKPLL
jgi:ribosomal protein S18 acetylase RimI-like enzyme